MEDKATSESSFAASSKLVHDFEANEAQHLCKVIDTLVYKLYGQADEEIGIEEGCNECGTF